MREGECAFRGDECTFDDGSLCAWTNTKENDFDWLVIKDSTPSLDTGPDFDHSMFVCFFEKDFVLIIHAIFSP